MQYLHIYIKILAEMMVNSPEHAQVYLTSILKEFRMKEKD